MKGLLRLATVLAILAPLASAETPEQVAFGTDVMPLVKSYCLGCHSGEKPKAGLDLTKYPDSASAMKSRKAWKLVLDAIESGTMPPEGKPRPSQAEVDRAVAWLQAQLSKADCRIQDDPGRVTLRRLNRAEYRNTIRDLLGVDYCTFREAMHFMRPG